MPKPAARPSIGCVPRHRGIGPSCRLGLAAAAVLVLAGACASGGNETATNTETASTEAGASASYGDASSAGGGSTSAPGVSTSATATGSGSSATSAPTPSPSAAPGATGCTAGPTAIPTGADQGPVVDVDGDGKGDTAWIASDASGGVKVGVVTAAGGGAVRTFDSASPVTRSILVIDPNEDSPPLILADDGRTVQLWAVIDCAIVDVLNKQGKRYEFSLGFTEIGTGVGCATVDGRHELVGLDAGDPDGSTIPWSSTVVSVSGNRATNGTKSSGTYTLPADAAAVDLLHTVSCDDRTIADNGLSVDA